MAEDKQNNSRIHLRIGRASNTIDEKRNFKLDNICIGNQNYKNNIFYDDKSNLGVPYSPLQSTLSKSYTELVNTDVNFIKNLQRRTKIPYIKVVEFEPDMVFKFTQHLEVISQTISRNLEAFASLVEKDGLSKIFKSVINEGSSLFGLEVPFDNPSNEKSERATDNLVTELFGPGKGKYKDRIVTNPIERYRNFFRGDYINSYELPYTDDTYMTVDGTNGWSVIGKEDINLQNDFLNSVWKIVSNLGIVDTNPIPIWKRNADGEFEYYNMSCEFYLNNKDLECLGKNYYFLITLISGPLWVQSGSRFFPPNIYTIDIPGVTNLLYSTMSVDVTAIGNKRKLPKYSGEAGQFTFYDNNQHRFLIDERFNGINRETYYPDAWKLTVTFKSLIPNNFNNYLNYLINGTMNVNTNTHNSGGTGKDLFNKFFGADSQKEQK